MVNVVLEVSVTVRLSSTGQLGRKCSDFFFDCNSCRREASRTLNVVRVPALRILIANYIRRT